VLSSAVALLDGLIEHTARVFSVTPHVWNIDTLACHSSFPAAFQGAFKHRNLCCQGCARFRGAIGQRLVGSRKQLS
jgi:hypothetical protein